MTGETPGSRAEPAVVPQAVIALRRLALVISVLFLAAGYAWLYTGELFRASHRDPALAGLAALALAGVWAPVFALHGLVLPWAERRLRRGRTDAALAPGGGGEPMALAGPLPLLPAPSPDAGDRVPAAPASQGG